MSLQIGDHVVAQKPGYTHHGLYIGNGQVIHYPGLDETHRPRPVEVATLDRFADGKPIFIKRHADRRFDGPSAVDRARQRLGACDYHLLANNCEHFVNWCIDGDHRSDQVDRGMTAASCSMVVGAAAAGRAAVARAGKVEGLSAPGIMSGLRAVGDPVGLGPVGGLLVLTGVSAVAGALVTNTAMLRDSPAHDPDERKARQNGRTSGYAAGAIAILLVLGLVSELGAVKGVSASGLSAGLSALGRPLSGGMATGIGIAVAIPLAAILITAYVVYRMSKHDKDGAPATA
jgi:hypothetical protein